MPKKTKPRSAQLAAAAPSKLTAFHDKRSEAFSFTRYNWMAGSTDRESLLPKFKAKLHPPKGDQADGRCADASLLLPDEAPQDYFDYRFLVRRYEECIPNRETIALAQLTMRFPEAPNLHRPFEEVRAWTKQHYCEKGLPALVVLHNPAMAGSANVGHVHVMVLPRRLSRLGWAEMLRDIGNDASRHAAEQSWGDHWSVAGKKPRK